MKYKLKGELDFKFALASGKEFIMLFEQLLKDLNIDFEGKIQPAEAEQLPDLEGRNKH